MEYRRRVTIDVTMLADIILKDTNYINAKKLSRKLGISTKSAGKLLSLLEKNGVLEKWSRKTYKVKGK